MSGSNNPWCTNCERLISRDAQYCSFCGEKQHDHRLSLRHLVAELVEHTLHFDTKTWRTLILLFGRPGLLPREYNRGRRTAFVAPLRLYIFVSFIFFLVIPMGGPDNARKGGESKEPKKAFNFAVSGIRSDELVGRDEKQVAELLKARHKNLNAFQKRLLMRAARYADGPEGMAEEFVHRFLKGLSYMMLVLVPVFSFLTWLLFRRPKHFYIEHLVFGLYFHCLFFAVFSIGKSICLLFGMSFLTSWMLLVAMLLTVIYLGIGLRRMYQQSVLKTVWKTIVVWSVYCLSILASTGIVSGIIFLWGAP